jgi:transposase
MSFSTSRLAVSAKYVVHLEHSEQNGVATQPFQTEEAPDEIHRNAKTTPAARTALCRRVLEDGWSNATTAAAFAVSERTVAKWVQRYRAGCRAALEDGSSRPGPAPHQTPARVVTQIRQLRVEQGLPAWAIARALGRPRSTVSAWLRRLGLSRPPTPSRPPARRYEWAQPGDLLHVDIKPLARIRAVGHRIHGQRGRVSKGVGWEYVHVAIDDHSRVAYVEVRRDQRGETCAAFLTRSVAWFATRAITVRRVMSDNGSGYVSRGFARRAGPSACGTSVPGRTRRARTASRNASSRPCSASGRMSWPTPRRHVAPASLRRSCATTTADDRMRVWTIARRGPGSRVLPDEQRTCTRQLVLLCHFLEVGHESIAP